MTHISGDTSPCAPPAPPISGDASAAASLFELRRPLPKMLERRELSLRIATNSTLRPSSAIIAATSLPSVAIPLTETRVSPTWSLPLRAAMEPLSIDSMTLYTERLMPKPRR